MKRYITIEGKKYLIRGPYKANDLKRIYTGFVEKYPDTKLTFAQWAVERGKVYLQVKS